MRKKKLTFIETDCAYTLRLYKENSRMNAPYAYVGRAPKRFDRIDIYMSLGGDSATAGTRGDAFSLPAWDGLHPDPIRRAQTKERVNETRQT